MGRSFARVVARCLVIAWSLWSLPAGAGAQDAAPVSAEAVFLEAWRVTANALYDPKMAGVDWEAVREELMPRARAARTPAELSAVINDALARLGASHTGHYTQDQREYYELLDVFFPEGVPERKGSAIKPGRVEYVGIGLATATVDGRVFAADVYSGGPADRAGVLAGDELIGVEGGPWGDVAPFRGREGKETKVTVQRTPEAASRRAIVVIPEVIRPRDLFLASIKAGARLIEHGGQRVAYVRIRSYAHPSYQEALEELLRGDLSTVDGLVLDIRGGWGGASPEYLNLFNPASPRLTYRERDGKEREWAAAWRKPVALLIDGGTRSGKEVIAYSFKKHRLGVLVGERTAGAVLAGTTRPLADGSVLYLAVNEVLVDGERLEGVGVAPDVEVKRALPYSAGRDAPVDAAVAALAELMKQPERGRQPPPR